MQKEQAISAKDFVPEALVFTISAAQSVLTRVGLGMPCPCGDKAAFAISGSIPYLPYMAKSQSQPGMLPALEQPDYFPDLHVSLCVYIRDWLAPRLPEAY